MAVKEITEADNIQGQDLDISNTFSPVQQQQNVANLDDPELPSAEVSTKRQRMSDLFTIFCAGFALISDGYQNNLMTATNVVLTHLYAEYTSYYSTQVSNALLVGDILGQLTIGLVCDYLGRKWAILITTAFYITYRAHTHM
ncbi:hypothetical protein GGR58DRAFT_123604 [Xylaria digitata]|nr:hypothetical protein GGR58DRAFT_123604 [Xylaria digitata]